MMLYCAKCTLYMQWAPERVMTPEWEGLGRWCDAIKQNSWNQPIDHDNTTYFSMLRSDSNLLISDHFMSLHGFQDQFESPQFKFMFPRGCSGVSNITGFVSVRGSDSDSLFPTEPFSLAPVTLSASLFLSALHNKWLIFCHCLKKLSLSSALLWCSRKWSDKERFCHFLSENKRVLAINYFRAWPSTHDLRNWVKESHVQKKERKHFMFELLIPWHLRAAHVI